MTGVQTCALPIYSALETPEVQRFLAVLKSDEFAARLTEMGGYTLEAPGEVIPVFA